MAETDVRQFWVGALCDMMSVLPATERAAAKWHMNGRTFEMLSDILALPPTVAYVGMWPRRVGEPLIMGQPVEFVNEEGVSFHA